MTTSTQKQITTHPCANDCIAYLQQGLDAICELDDAQYITTLPPVFISGVGAHVRHILDHFHCFLTGLKDNRIDYDLRQRDPHIERERLVAIDAMKSTMSSLLEIEASVHERPLLIKMDSGCAGEQWAESSLTRELQFLVSHTIHHYALMAAILAHAGFEVTRGFGISPSTLRHQAR
ncbi:MAG: hypothetical protein AB8G16_00565 [Gammaproteobacteria bacterium]